SISVIVLHVKNVGERRVSAHELDHVCLLVLDGDMEECPAPVVPWGWGQDIAQPFRRAQCAYCVHCANGSSYVDGAHPVVIRLVYAFSKQKRCYTLNSSRCC